MMKIRIWTMSAVLTGLLTLSGCIKEEPLNTECDILEASVSVENPEAVFFQVSDSLVHVNSADSEIKFVVRSSADLRQLAPHFVITEGSTIEPASGSVHDFSAGAVGYTVTSQDGQWQRHYQVAFTPVVVTKIDTVKFDFENYQLDENYGKYYVWYEEGADGPEKVWASGNGGFHLANSSKTAEEYPTVPCDDGFEGKAIKLKTLDTGPLGRTTGRPIAAGNMFLGAFNTSIALRDALHATEMGVPFTEKPVKLTGYYKYEVGPTLKNKQQQVMEGRDSADIYSVLYLNHDADNQSVVLYGDNVLSSPLIVRKARIPEVKVTDEWTYFEIDFEELGDIDDELLKGRGYNLALVFSSSIHGERFEGAIGSTLLIDKIRIICTRDE